MKVMSCSPSPCDGIRNDIARWLAEAGAAASGIAQADTVDESEFSRFAEWLDKGMHGDMQYMERYRDIRRDPALLLDGAKSIIVAVFSYHHSGQGDGALGAIASYAHGDDYHEVVRGRLGQVAALLKGKYGGETRVCADSAPLLERYRAVRAGVGFIGRNRMLIVPGVGSYVFIGSILTTLDITPDSPCTLSCYGCGRCIISCPGKALTARGLDARKCLSYLTIEYRGEFPDSLDLKGCLYGCDTCQRVCPHNAGIPDTTIAEFAPRPALSTLTPEKAAAMTLSEFSTMMRHSAIKRTKLAGLQRNALTLLRSNRPKNKEQ